MKKTLSVILAVFAFVACDDAIKVQTINVEEEAKPSVSATLGGVGMTLSEVAAPASKAVDSSTKKNYNVSELSQLDSALASFFVRIDGEKPDVTTSIATEQPSSNYYPQTSAGKSLNVINNYVKSKEFIEAAGSALQITDATGVEVAKYLKRVPTVEDVKATFDSKTKVVYHGEVIYDQSQGIDKLFNDRFKIIWYVIKYQGGNDKVIHVDGALIPTFDFVIEIPDLKDEDHNTYYQVDDFAIRKSVIDTDEYITPTDDAKYEVNFLSYFTNNNIVKISRGSDMKIYIDDADKLDWSKPGTIWTFETWLWGKELTDAQKDAWAQDIVEGKVCDALGVDEHNNVVVKSRYDVKYNVYKGFQSEGTVPYCKVSVHIEQIPAE